MKLHKKIGWALLIGFVLFNISAAFHGYAFTHFADTDTPKPKIEDLSIGQKLGILFFGISNPRPVNTNFPQAEYERVFIQSGKEKLEGWYIPADSAKGEVILFHGYAGEKGSMLERARLIREMGYNTLLVDFRGSGGSTGNATTIGYKESQDVRASVGFLVSQGKTNIFLFGTSMGAASILKAIAEEDADVQKIIIECPFGSLLQTAKNRFENMGLPPFPAAHFLVFWGGIENSFWGFSHNPSEYAKRVHIPTLLIYGEQDERVKRFEIDNIYEHLSGQKELLLFPEAGHINYLEVDQAKWERALSSFLP